MAFTKYNRVEASELATPEDHKKIQAGLKKVGKTSLKDLTEEEREEVLKKLK